MTRVLLFLLLLSVPALAQTVYTFPSSSSPISVPEGEAVTITAFVNGSANTAITWTTSGGTLYGTTSCLQEPCTIGVYSATTGTITVTATQTGGTAAATQQFSFTAAPTVVTGHPKLLLTPALVTTIQSRCASSFLACQALRTMAINAYNTAVGGGGGWGFTWTCNGGTGEPTSPDYADNYYEGDAYLFAYMALAFPSDPTYNWGCYGRDVQMFVEAGVKSGALVIQSGNQWSQAAMQFSVTPDWLMASGSLSGTDISNTRTYLAYFMQQILDVNNQGSLGSYNNWNNYQQFNTGNKGSLGFQRAMGSNYTQAKLLEIAAMSLTFDDNSTDDPDIPTGSANTCGASRYVLCSDFTGGSLHAYFAYYSGAFLLKEYAHLEDPTVVQQTLNAFYPSGGFSTIPSCSWADGTGAYPCFGDDVGGESSEGEGYWSHIAFARYAMDILYTTGYDDPRTPANGGPYYGGPQMSLVNSSYWDLSVLDTRNFMLNFGANGQAASPGYTMLTTGDTNHYVFYPSDFQNISALYLYDALVGRTDRSNAEQWILYNAAFGGPLGTSGGCTAYCGFDAVLDNDFGSQVAPDVLAANPNSDPVGGTLPTDPGAGYPTAFYVNSYNQHLTIRSGYASTDSGVSIYGANALIDHEHEYQGGYEVFQNGEYILKGRTEFDDYNDAMAAAVNRNTASYINTGGDDYAYCAGDQQGPAILYGGQFWHSYQVPPLTQALHSESPDYAAYTVDDTNAYNGCPHAGTLFDDVLAASRDILYLRGTNQIITYDRGETGSTNDKSTWLTTTGAITVSGNRACWPTHSTTQKGCFTSLLPSGTNPTAVPLIVYTSMTAPHSTLQQSTTMQMTCTAHYADGTTANISSSPIVNWSSDEAAITITSTGLVTAAGSVSASANIYCNPYNLTSTSPVVVGSSSSGSISVTGEQAQLGDPEPYAQIEVDGGTGTNQQFLGFTEWGAASYTPTTATLVQSSAGQNYDGALLGSTLAMFMRSLTTFTGSTWAASGATTQYVSDLAPNTTYTVTGAGTPSTVTSDNAGVATFAATGTGNITVGAYAPPEFVTLDGMQVTGGDGMTIQ